MEKDPLYIRTSFVLWMMVVLFLSAVFTSFAGEATLSTSFENTDSNRRNIAMALVKESLASKDTSDDGTGALAFMIQRSQDAPNAVKVILNNAYEIGYEQGKRECR